MPRLLLICLFAVVTNTSHAGNIDPDSTIGKALNNASQDFITCAGLYAVISSAAERSDGPDASELATNAVEANIRALDIALDFAKQTRTEEMAEKVTLARFKMVIDSMGEEIEGDFSNTSILLSKHGKRCRSKMESPAAVFNEWLEKIEANK